MADGTGPGYHLAKIKKGVLGELSKIQEELDELKDAEQQDLKVMQLVELSDLLGAINAYVGKHFNGISMTDLDQFAQVTSRAFRNGHRGVTVVELSRQVSTRMKVDPFEQAQKCFNCGGGWGHGYGCSECQG